jgi:hypothetical protein
MELEREYLRGARRKARATKDYFDDDDGDEVDGHASMQQRQSAAAANGDDDDVDPLDAFMQGIESQVVKQKSEKKPFVKVWFG